MFFLPIDVKIEVGEIVGGFSLPYKDKSGRTQIDFVRGMVEKVDNIKKEVKIEKYAERIPFNRIEWFTFGGIQMDNKDFSYDEVFDY